MVSIHAEQSGSGFFRRRHGRGLEELRCALFVGMVGIMAGWSVACSPLEPIDEPEMSDLQLTVDTLKTSLRDSQRTIVELRAEADSRRQEFAELLIARAQLEGRVREAERRLSEARHVIELQREELAGSRSERERTSRAGARLHSQLKQPQKQTAALNTSVGAGMAGMSSSTGQRTGIASARGDQPDWIEDSEAAVSTPAVHRPQRAGLDERPLTTSPVRIAVKRGDTLWSIAQRYQIPLKRLMAINGLTDTQIQAGQALWLAESPASSSRSYEATE
jgi:Tfp pilus assembly protein FimV